MLGTAAEYQTVDGLQPDPNKHLIFADIEPVCSMKYDFIIKFRVENILLPIEI